MEERAAEPSVLSLSFTAVACVARVARIEVADAASVMTPIAVATAVKSWLATLKVGAPAAVDCSAETLLATAGATAPLSRLLPLNEEESMIVVI